MTERKVSEQSPEAAWAKAFVAAQKDMPEIHKGRTVTVPTKNGKSYSYKYAELSQIISEVKPVLAKNGLAYAQDTRGSAAIEVETRIYHDAGHVEKFGPLVLAAGNDAKEAGSAITYARRYALCAALGIAPDEDDDGAAAKTVTRAPKSEPVEGVQVADNSNGEVPEWVDELMVAHTPKLVVNTANTVLASRGKKQWVKLDNLQLLANAPDEVREAMVRALTKDSEAAPSSTSDQGPGASPQSGSPGPAPLSDEEAARLDLAFEGK